MTKKVITVVPSGNPIPRTLAVHASRVSFGMREEQRIMQEIATRYRTGVVKGTSYEDRRCDIDCYVGDVAVSIKSQPIALSSGNFGFELEVFDKDTKAWEESWYHTGQASVYVIAVGDDLYHIQKSKLVAYVDVFGWDSINELSARVKATQVHHQHLNSKCGLIRITTLLKHNVARFM